MRALVRGWFAGDSRSERLVDVALGLTAMVLNVAGSLLPDPSVAYEYNDPHVPTLIAVAAMPGAALIWRRQFPLFGFLVSLGAVAFVNGVGWQTGNMPGTLVFASYALGAWAPARRGLTGLAVMYVSMAIFVAFREPYFDEWIALSSPVIFTLPWVLGTANRRRRLAGERAIARALELERERAVVMERAVADERLRMARELHDIVTHTLSIIAVQSGVARHLLPAEGDGARGALEVIETSSRTALDDLRRMLGLLRGEYTQEAHPSPGLDGLMLLVSTHRVTHGPVTIDIDPGVEAAPPSVRLTVFRLVQEALTNAAKHAPGAPVSVAVRLEAALVVVTVENDGTNTSPDVAARGFGLAGMRERVALFGGTLQAGPRPDGGYFVRAELRQGSA